LSLLHRTVLPFYHFYCEPKKTVMNFNGFCRFCGDFGIFPDILSKPKLLRFFKTLASFYDLEHNEQAVIDEHLFVEALALTAFEVVYKNPEPSNFSKLVLLIEKMNHSDGP